MEFARFWKQDYATTGQYFFTRVISQRLGAVAAYAAWRAGLSPNAVTVTGLAISLAGSACLALSAGSTELLLAALLLYQVGFGLDCADGQLARATGRCSPFGAWLDIASDHVRQIGMLLALMVLLWDQAELSRVAVTGALFVLGSGLTVSLHTVAVLKSGSYRPHGLRGIGAWAKRIIKEVNDTPFVLLVICILQPIPPAQIGYLYLIGIFNLAQAYSQAVLRIAAHD